MSSKCDQLVATALRRFACDGFHATGIDAVLRESGVAKKTLYHHFKSKDELIVAALTRRDQEFRAKMRTVVARLAPLQEGDARMARVLAFFDGLDEWFTSDDFSGCIFINASAEYPRAEHPVHQVCTAHKKRVVASLEVMLADLGLADVSSAARQVAMIADGAVVSAHTVGDRGAAMVAKAAVRRLLEVYVAR